MVHFGDTIAKYVTNYAHIKAPGAYCSRTQTNPPGAYDKQHRMTELFCSGDGTVTNVHLSLL